jgi:hypothetical protein
MVMAYSYDQWLTIKAYFERGLTLAEIVRRDDVLVKSRGSISKRAKSEGWVAGKKKQLVTQEVQLKQQLSAVQAQKETLPAIERNIHDELVSEQLKFTVFFRGANMMLANTVASKVREQGNGATFQDLNSAASALGRAQESVLGKVPEMVVHSSNIVQLAVGHSPQELRRLNQELEDAC